MKKVSVTSHESAKSKEVKKMDVDLEEALDIAGSYWLDFTFSVFSFL